MRKKYISSNSIFITFAIMLMLICSMNIANVAIVNAKDISLLDGMTLTTELVGEKSDSFKIQVVMNMKTWVGFGISQGTGMSMMSGNGKGIAVADIATEEDLDELTSFCDVVVLESGVNAAGNLIECNAHGAVVSPVVPQEGVKMISEVLVVDALHSKVAGHDTVGSMLVANGNGVLAHPDITREEAEAIESAMKVPVMVGTVTFG